MSDSVSDLRITAKRLGIILLLTYCPRCLWYLLKLSFKPPFPSPGGALWTDMEVMQRAVIDNYLETDGQLPEQFAPFRDIVGRVEYPRHWSKFGYRHASGVWLYGVPDDIYKLSDGSITVVDEKSAHYKGDDDPYLCQYNIQVIGYGNIAELGLNLGKVSKGGIFYWDVQREDVIKNPSKFIRNGRLCPPFKVNPVEVEMDFDKLDPLLKELKKVWKNTVPPDGRDGCNDCERREALFAIENELVAKDHRLLNNAPYLQDAAGRRIYRRQYIWAATLSKLVDADAVSAEPGMVAAWNE